MAIGKFSCFHCGDSIVGHKKDCPELTGIAEATCKHNVKKQKIEIEIEVPDGYEFERMKKYGQFPGVSYVPEFKDAKPAKKVIDLSCIVGSGIDCEFSDNGEYWVIFHGFGGTRDHKERSYCPLKKTLEPHDFGYKFCRIRQSPHVHFWKGGDKCPIPEGLRVKLYYRDVSCSGCTGIERYNKLIWLHSRSAGDIIAFEVLGVADGWRYEWEQE